MQANCPSCGAEVKFRSKMSVFAVCAFCKSMLVRHDLNLEALGKMGELQDDPSPLQLGTRGKYEGVGFEVVGRLVIGWSEGNWSEWFIALDDGRSGWLAEAQGFYGVCFRLGEVRSLPDPRGLKPGSPVNINGKLLAVDDIKQATCVGSAGELPFSGATGRKSASIDLAGRDNDFATIDYSDDGVSVYYGKYVDLPALALTNLRAFDGW